VARRGLVGARVLALVVIGPAACSDVETAAPPVDVPVRAQDEPEPPKRDPAAPPRRSLAKRIAPLLAPPLPPEAEEVVPGLERVGVPECDDYLRNYIRCIEATMPEASRKPMRDAMTEAAKAWRDVAANPGTSAALAEGCRAATDAAKSAFSTMGCTWE
jgi:hypothetical protein